MLETVKNGNQQPSREIFSEGSETRVNLLILIAKRVGGMMLRKDLRSMVLSLVLGDGCLHYIKHEYKGKTTLYGGLTIDHGIGQSDYQAWKAQLLSFILDKQIKVRTGHKGKSVQISVSQKRFRSWRKFVYRDGKKDIARILPFITNPLFALAIWLMDDGYDQGSFSKLKDGEKKLYGSRLRIFTCSETLETHDIIIEWFKENFDVDANIGFQKSSKQGKSYPFLKFGQKDSLKIWKEIRDFVLQFKSMRHKFRYIETTYQKRYS